MIRLIFPLLFLFACSTTEKSEMKKEENTNTINRIHDIWVLETIDGETMPSGLSKHPTIEIFVAENRMGGNDGCNSIGGSIKKLTETELVFGAMMSTKMACPNMDFSRNFSNKLSETTNYQIKNMKLILFNADNNELLKFKKVD